MNSNNLQCDTDIHAEANFHKIMKKIICFQQKVFV